MTDLFIINFKAYRKGTGIHAKKLLKELEEIPSSNIIVCLNPADTHLANQTSITCYAQLTHRVEYGSNTGHIPTELVKDLGCEGVIINHSENTLPAEEVDLLVRHATKQGLKSVVCVPTVRKAKKYSSFKPSYIAIEPPSLIGGDVSVSSSQPSLIKDAVNATKNIPLLCGAGVKSAEDVRKAKELGSQGILVASGVVKAESPVRAAKNMIQGFSM